MWPFRPSGRCEPLFRRNVAAPPAARFFVCPRSARARGEICANLPSARPWHWIPPTPTRSSACVARPPHSRSACCRAACSRQAPRPGATCSQSVCVWCLTNFWFDIRTPAVPVGLLIYSLHEDRPPKPSPHSRLTHLHPSTPMVLMGDGTRPLCVYVCCARVVHVNSVYSHVAREASVGQE